MTVGYVLLVILAYLAGIGLGYFSGSILQYNKDKFVITNNRKQILKQYEYFINGNELVNWIDAYLSNKYIYPPSTVEIIAHIKNMQKFNKERNIYNE